MGQLIYAIIIAAIAGGLMAFQGSMNSTLSKTAGLLGATLVVHVIGLITIIPLLFFFKNSWNGLKHVFEAPKYAYLGGIISVAIIYLVASSISKSGMVSATTAIIGGQITTAVLIDSFGWFGIDKCSLTLWKILGIIFLGLGTYLTIKPS